jgi:hypothetical protein
MTVVQLKTARQLTHPAISRAQEINAERNEDNRLRDLTEAETTFLASVRLAGMRRTKYVGDAVRQWGDLTEDYWRVVRLANNQERADLTLAMRIFQASVEADDELDEILFATAAE